MRSRDLDECARIIGATPLFQEYAFGRRQARKVLSEALRDRGNDLLVAMDTDSRKVLGFSWFVRRGAFHRSPYLRLIAVAPKTTGRGVGSALLDVMEKKYLEPTSRPSGLFLLVTETNRGARRFYQRRGYRRLGTIPNYVKDGVNECIYFKPPYATPARSTKRP